MAEHSKRRASTTILSPRAKSAGNIVSRAEPSATRFTICTLAVVVCFVALVVCAYQFMTAYRLYVVHRREMDLRGEFLAIPNIQRFPFVREEVEKSANVMEVGLWPHVITELVEKSDIVRAITLKNPWVAGAFVLVVLWAMWLTYKFFVTTFWMSQAHKIKTHEMTVQQQQQPPPFAQPISEEHVRTAIAQSSPSVTCCPSADVDGASQNRASFEKKAAPPPRHQHSADPQHIVAN